MRIAFLGAAVAGLAVASTPATANASPWRTSAFSESAASGARLSIDREDAAIAPDGSMVAAWWAVQRRTRGRTVRRALRVALAAPSGRLGRPRTVARAGVSVVAAGAASGGRALVVWSARGRLRAVLRSRAGAPLRFRDLGRDTSEVINELFAVAAPDGGWLIAERSFARGVYGVRVVRLTAGGRVREDRLLGRGQFGLDSPSAPAAFARDGSAWFGADRSRELDGSGDAAGGTWTAAPGAAFGRRTRLADRLAAGLRVATGGARGVAVSWTSRVGGGESGPFGAPRIALSDDAGGLGPSFGPELPRPRRAFGAAAAPLGAAWLLTWHEKAAPAPFRLQGLVRGAVLRDGVLGPARTLVADARATDALATGLAGDRALLRYTVGRAVRLALIGATGRPRALAAPRWPRESAYARTTTRTAGSWALVTRVDGRVIRAAMRRLPVRG